MIQQRHVWRGLGESEGRNAAAGFALGSGGGGCRRICFAFENGSHPHELHLPFLCANPRPRGHHARHTLKVAVFPCLATAARSSGL